MDGVLASLLTLGVPGGAALFEASDSPDLLKLPGEVLLFGVSGKPDLKPEPVSRTFIGKHQPEEQSEESGSSGVCRKNPNLPEKKRSPEARPMGGGGNCRRGRRTEIEAKT